MLAELLDQTPFNLAIADLYKTRFNGVPGVVYAAGVRHAYNVAQAFRDLGMKAQGGLGRDAQARAGADPGRLRVGQDRRARQRPAARRGLEQPAGDDLHAPGADRVQADLPAARRPRDPPPPGQGGGDRHRLRPPGDQARRPGRHAALAARPRRLPRRRDRRRAGPARPRPAGPGRAPGAAGHARSRAAGARYSSASCGGSRSSTSTTASSTCGPRWPAPASRPTAGGGPRRCSTSTAAAS